MARSGRIDRRVIRSATSIRREEGSGPYVKDGRRSGSHQWGTVITTAENFIFTRIQTGQEMALPATALAGGPAKSLCESSMGNPMDDLGLPPPRPK